MKSNEKKAGGKKQPENLGKKCKRKKSKQGERDKAGKRLEHTKNKRRVEPEGPKRKQKEQQGGKDGEKQERGLTDLKSIEEGGGRKASMKSMAGRTGRRTKAGKTSMDEAGKAVKRQEKAGKERNTVKSRDWQSSRGKQGK